MRKSKQVCYNADFETNWNNIKDTWRKIKTLTHLKAATGIVPTVFLLVISNKITNRYDTANSFHNYYSSLAEITKTI